MLYDTTNQITESRTATNKAIANHDIKTLMSYFSDDIIIIRGDGSVLQNKTVVEKTWQKIFIEQPTISFIRSPDEIVISNNKLNAWEKGKWQGVNTYSSGGNYAAVWQYDNNIWKIKAEFFVAL